MTRRRYYIYVAAVCSDVMANVIFLGILVDVNAFLSREN